MKPLKAMKKKQVKVRRVKIVGDWGPVAGLHREARLSLIEEI